MATGTMDREVSTWARIVSTLKDVAEGIVTYLGSLVDGLRNGSAKIDEISTEIAKTDTKFAIQLKDFYKDLKFLEQFYTRIYEKTKAMVEYGLNNGVIPNIIKLIEERNYSEASKEITSFLKALATRIKEILDQIDKDKVTTAEEVKGQVKKITSQYEKSKQQMGELVEEGKKAECFRIGTNTLLLLGISGAGMFLWGDRPVSEKLELVSTYVASNPGVLSFITDKGIQGLNAITAPLRGIDDLKKTIEDQAQNMCTHFYNCYAKITEFQVQINAIEVGTTDLKKYMEKVQSELQGDANEKATAEWKDVETYLKQMLGVFKNLDKEVVEKQISWGDD